MISSYGTQLLPEGIVVTAEKPDTYLIESGFDNNNGIYVVRSATDNY